MKYNIVFGGKAGQGPNILSEVVAAGLIDRGFFVFYSRDYQSLIRGGHNFNTLSFSDLPIHSNISEIDMLVCLDEETLKIHKAKLKKNSIVLDENHGNMYFAGAIYKILGLDFFFLEKELRELKNFEDNIVEARKGYNNEKRTLGFVPLSSGKNIKFMNGSKAMAEGALKSGLEIYYAYPMTPATPLMMELGQAMLDKKNKHKVVELENETAVMIAGLGSSAVGALSMVGSSGGGFDLMTEGLSMAGMAEIPIVAYLSQRPGPGTGVATYTSQGDLNMALHSGHGEFNRIVLSPGDATESEELTNLCFYFSQKFRVPAILLSDKHLGESKYCSDKEAKIIPVIKSIVNPERFNSYEFDRSKDNIATEDAEVIKKNFDLRKKKKEEIAREAEKFEMIKFYGNEKSKNLIISGGSTKGVILDCLENCEKEIDAKFMHILFLEPFPSKKVLEEIKKAKKIIIVENNSESPLSRLIAEKTGVIIEDRNKILRYDGRPFFSDELSLEISRRLG